MAQHSPSFSALSPLLQEQAEQDGGEEAQQQFDASFLLMMMTFTEFLPVLFEALGGEEIPQGV